MYAAMSSAKKNKCSSSLTVCRPYTYFSWLTELRARTSSSRMLNRSSKSWHACFVFDFKEKQLGFPHWCIVSCSLFLDAFLRFRKFPSISVLLSIFIMYEYWIWAEFSVCDRSFFSFILLMCWITFINFLL